MHIENRDGLAPQGAGADEHGVGGQGVLLGELLGARLEALADIEHVLPDVLGLLDKQIELGEAAAAVEQAQAEAVGEVVALLAAARTMVRSHGDAVLGADSLADGALGLGHGVDAHAHALHLLDGLEDLGVVPDSEAVSTTDFSVMRLWPMTFHSAAWIR